MSIFFSPKSFMFGSTCFFIHLPLSFLRGREPIYSVFLSHSSMQITPFTLRHGYYTVLFNQAELASQFHFYRFTLTNYCLFPFKWCVCVRTGLCPGKYQKYMSMPESKGVAATSSKKVKFKGPVLFHIRFEQYVGSKIPSKLC